jgi:hypothetical protein
MDEETLEIMENNDIDEEQAERVKELVEEGLDEEDAVEIAENE